MRMFLSENPPSPKYRRYPSTRIRHLLLKSDKQIRNYKKRRTYWWKESKRQLHSWLSVQQSRPYCQDRTIGLLQGQNSPARFRRSGFLGLRRSWPSATNHCVHWSTVFQQGSRLVHQLLWTTRSRCSCRPGFSSIKTLARHLWPGGRNTTTICVSAAICAVS